MKQEKENQVNNPLAVFGDRFPHYSECCEEPIKETKNNGKTTPYCSGCGDRQPPIGDRIGKEYGKEQDTSQTTEHTSYPRVFKFVRGDEKNVITIAYSDREETYVAEPQRYTKKQFQEDHPNDEQGWDAYVENIHSDAQEVANNTTVINIDANKLEHEEETKGDTK